MPWQTSRPRGGRAHPRYTNQAHKQLRANLIAQLQRDGTGHCAEPICRYRSRLITPAMQLHVSHDRATGRVLGLSHAFCNVSEAGRHARAKQDASRLRW